MVLEAAHKNAVTELHWFSDGKRVVTAGADDVVAVWDAEVGKRARKLAGHTSFVNSCAVSSSTAAGSAGNMIASGASSFFFLSLKKSHSILGSHF